MLLINSMNSKWRSNRLLSVSRLAHCATVMVTCKGGVLLLMQARSLMAVLMQPNEAGQQNQDSPARVMLQTAAGLEEYCKGMAAQLPAPYGCNNPGAPARVHYKHSALI